MFATKQDVRLKNTRSAVLIGCCVVMATCLVVGCGGRGVPTEVRGTVVLDGKPVYPGVVMLKADTGSGLTANLNDQGEFRVFNVKEGNKYAVAVEAIKLAGLSKAPARNRAEEPQQAEGEPPRREATVPDEFKNANIDIPEKYLSFETSGLVIDCTNGIPTAPVELKLD